MADASVAAINVTAIELSGEAAPLGDPISMRIVFDTDRPVDGFWRTRYIVDHAVTRKIIELGQTQAAQYSGSANSVSIHTPALDLAGMSSALLRNMGLLVVSMHASSDEAEIIQVSLVVQVQRAADKSLTRLVFNPLE